MRHFDCHFDHIGRNRLHRHETFSADTPEGLATEVWRFVSPQLLSSEVEVLIDLDEMQGQLVVGGWRPVGTFSIKEVDDHG